jgi:hypothetical protein
MRRYLIIGAGVIVILGLLLAVYFYFFASGSGVAVAPAGSVSLPSAGTGTGSGNIPSTTSGSATSATPASPTVVTSRLVRIDSGPIVLGEATLDVNLLPDGSIATSTKNASTTPDVDVEYLERESGNIFSYLVGAKVLTRISDTTLPGIQEADWLPGGSGTFVRYLSGSDSSTINTYLLPSNGQGGFFLPQNLVGLSVGSTSVLTLASGVNGSLGTTLNPNGSNSTIAFNTPLSMVRSSFAGKNEYLVFTKPSTTLDGYVYLVDSSGNFSRLAGPLPGLVALASPSGTWVLVSYSSSGVMDMELINTQTRVVIPLPVATIADKCVWTLDESSIYCGIPQNPSTSYAYPDDWYQGAVSFDDQIWKIDVADRFAQLTLNFTSLTGESLDAESLSVDPENKELVFVNKNDDSLWSYQL